MASGFTGRGRRIIPVMIAATAAVGLSMIGLAITGQQSAPEPASAIIGTVPGGPTSAPAGHPGVTRSAGAYPSSQTTVASTSSWPSSHKTPGPSARKPTHKPISTTPKKSAVEQLLQPSRPVRLVIAAIRVDTRLTTVGLTQQGGIDVPAGQAINEAAWFDQSPTPGQFGAAVILGHIDTEQGPSVFFQLGGLRPGNQITITRADGRSGVFVVDGLEDYPERSIINPAQAYLGPVNRSELRLVTCANFNHNTGHYQGNVIVFAHLQQPSN